MSSFFLILSGINLYFCLFNFFHVLIVQFEAYLDIPFYLHYMTSHPRMNIFTVKTNGVFGSALLCYSFTEKVLFGLCFSKNSFGGCCAVGESRTKRPLSKWNQVLTKFFMLHIFLQFTR